MSEKYNTLGDRIKERRQSLCLSQAELAQQLHCTQAALSQYENGNREPGLQELKQIALVLNTSTDYLLGVTHIRTVDADIKLIGNYLGLTEEAISILHDFYWDYKGKVEKDYIQSEVSLQSGTVPGDEGYEEDFQHIMNGLNIDLHDYMKFINEFITSSAFKIVSRKLCNNLYLERHIYDMLRVVTRQYDQIESELFVSDVVGKACALVDDSEDYLNQYLLNVFETHTALLNFIQEFTMLEVVKELEYKESFYRKVHYFLYEHTPDMYERERFSFEEFDAAMIKDELKLVDKATKILKNYK